MHVDLLSTWMSDGPIDWVGAVLELAAGGWYVTAARHRSRRGARSPIWRTAAFVAGLLVIALALQSPLGAYDDVPWVHMLQHVLLMMLAPLLLVLGAPVTVTLRAISPADRRRLVRVLHDPSLRGLLSNRWVIFADYNLAMVALLLAPVYRLTGHEFAIHVASHLYLLLCGLLFWLPTLAQDPVPGRLNARTRRAMIAANVPVGFALAVAVLLDPGLLAQFSPDQSALAATIIAAGTALTGLLGLTLIGSPRTTTAPARQWSITATRAITRPTA